MLFVNYAVDYLIVRLFVCSGNRGSQRTPLGIKDKLQTIIQNIIASNDSATSRNSVKATFDKDTLSEVHASLNNVDKLRSLVAKCYQKMHPYEHFENSQILIICMLDLQAKELQKLKSFQIDLTFKRVHGDINEFKINSYDNTHKLTEAYQRLFSRLFEVIENLSGIAVKFYHIDSTRKEKEAKKEIKKTVMSEITNQEKPRIKRKSTIDDNVRRKKNKIDNGDQENSFEIDRQHTILQIEIEERKMQLAERQTANHRALAEIEKLELENIKLRKELEN
ncbi:hypothetical protein RhiirC2_793959 [Rhizophagus irregularis]|uniref:Uncharacterized protein n=1 Tax=Rhizophagus irregularis TaxID=588596 RepID=A0A2N1MEE8_9GLOM|nr:hypothetical protein RhiirC2_793959 [Rhizophagus irregularis]